MKSRLFSTLIVAALNLAMFSLLNRSAAAQGPVTGVGDYNGFGVSATAGNVGVYAHNNGPDAAPSGGHDAYLATRCCAGDFNGPVRVHGTTTTQTLEITGGSDVAEPFKIASDAAIQPGMVVAIDPQQGGQLRIADKAYDRTVVGIVSGANGLKPALTMTHDITIAERSLPVALSGRVYCWADATNGPIKPGDLLTTSGTLGHAMRVTDYHRAQGAILGKAMSSLQAGTGLVLVLVTLQ
jgi:hypothetical protein